MGHSTYKDKLRELLTDTSTYERVAKDPTKKEKCAARKNKKNSKIIERELPAPVYQISKGVASRVYGSPKNPSK